MTATWATLGVVVSSVMMGSVPVFARALTDAGLSAVSVSFYRNAVGTVLLLGLLRFDAHRRSATLWALGAGLGMGLGWASYVRAVEVVDVSTAGVIYMSYPLFAIGLAWLIFRQRPTGRAVLAGLVVLGASLVAVGSSLDGQNAEILAVAFAAPLSFGFAVAVLTERLTRLRPIERVAPIAAGSTVGLLPIVATQSRSETIPPDIGTWLLVFGIAVLTAIGPQWLYSLSAPNVGPARAAVAGSAELPMMFLVGWAWFGEALTVNQLLAGLLVVLAVLIVPSRQSPAVSIVRRRRRLIPGRFYSDGSPPPTDYGVAMPDATSPGLDLLVQDLRSAATASDPAAAVATRLQAAVADPAALRESIPHFADDDVIVFEDETVSIWHCRFPPGVTVPPHDHQMTATIAVYDGAEQNDFYRLDEQGAVVLDEAREVRAGEVLQVAGDRIHGVRCASETASLAIHVYLGALSVAERSLFDPSTGERLPMSDENYAKLTSTS